MSKPKFTPGPWKAGIGNRLSDGDDVWVVDSENGSIAEMMCPADVEEVNARLIAAAPALYEALLRMRCTCDAASRYGHYDGPHCNATIARAALALVESEGK